MKTHKHIKKHSKIQECCRSRTGSNSKKHKGFWQGLAYGLIPHIGCIAFIIASILGVTVLTSLFKPLLMNRYFFYILMAVSLAFATLSSALYLRNLGMLSWDGIKRKKGYLAIMYGTTIGINLLLFLVIFPMLANINTQTSYAQTPGYSIESSNTLKLKVAIPCPGHASLITNEIKTLAGVQDVRFSFPNVFDVTYSSPATKQAILSLKVFSEYKATTIDETVSNVQPIKSTQEANAGSCGCGSAAGCGSGSGSCGCGKS